MLIRKAQLADSKYIVKMHVLSINEGFLSSLGNRFLELMYKTMIKSSNSFCIISEDYGKIVGFITGTNSVKGFYKEFIMKNFIKGCILLFPKLIKPKFIIGILETLVYPIKIDQNLPEAELVSIVVDKNYRGKGASKKLFDGLVSEFKKRDVKLFKVVVGSHLVEACNYYRKMGGVYNAEIEVHKGVKSKILVWDIRNL